MSGESGLVYSGDLKLPLPRNPMHRHGSLGSLGVFPEIDLALVEGTGGEGKQDWVSTASLHDFTRIGEFRPGDDIAKGAIRIGDVPIHETGPRLGPG